ncbi:MAG: hypothetical protein PHX18_01340 [Candidatus Gastranaerophilales bacterium]|nr:hypothetical protein [Candidatus Gastranaerophilales bacterium]
MPEVKHISNIKNPSALLPNNNPSVAASVRLSTVGPSPGINPVVYLGALAFLTIAGLGGKKMYDIANIARREVMQFPQDILYRKNLLTAMGLNPAKFADLRSVLGKGEFLHILKKAQTTPEIYKLPDLNTFASQKTKFGMNLHLHTQNSDGQLSVQALLNHARKYANRYFKDNGKPFIMAITDHDGINGCKEALEIIARNPDQFKNLRVVLGTEISTNFHSQFAKKPTCVHMLSYCINPFDPKVGALQAKQTNDLKSAISNAFNKANELYGDVLQKFGFKYSLEGYAKIRPSILTSPNFSQYSMKDYMQFRLIFADIIEKNPAFLKTLQEKGIKLTDLDFSHIKIDNSNLKPNAPYWANYLDSAHKYVTTKIKQTSPSSIQEDFTQYFKKVSDEAKTLLERIEREFNDPSKGMTVHPPALLNFDDAAKAYANINDSMLGIAHPGFVYLDNKNSPDVQKIIEDLYTRLKTYMKGKTAFHEAFYQDYPVSSNPERIIPAQMLDFINVLGEKSGFEKTGGIDSHMNNIFTSQKYLKDSDLIQFASA